MQNLNDILKANNLSINELLIQNMDKTLTLKDFLVFLKLLNTSCECFDCSKIAKNLGLTEEDVMTSFNNLIVKGFIEYKTITVSRPSYIASRICSAAIYATCKMGKAVTNGTSKTLKRNYKRNI